ncbi:hypothetical protein [Azospirillum melinis]
MRPAAPLIVLTILAMTTACSTVNTPKTIDSTKPSCEPYIKDGTFLFTADAQTCRAQLLRHFHSKDMGDLQQERAVYTLTTLAAGIVGAAGLLYDAHRDLLMGAGLTAGSVQTLAGVGDPAGKQLYLMRANTRLACIRQVAQGTVGKDAAGAELQVGEYLSDAIDTVEDNLLVQWLSSTASPDFGKVVANLTETAKTTTGTRLLENGQPQPPNDKQTAAKNALTAALLRCTTL